MPWPFTRSKPEVSQATGFDFSLFRELAALAISENVLISPTSVRLCLSLLYDGARGETRRGLAQALGFDGLGEDEVRLATVGLKSAQLSSGAGVQLLLATSLWFQEGIGIDPLYIARAREIYDAEINELDFQRPEAVSRINAWVSQKTAGKIPTMASGFDPLTVLVALNAIYFKGLWARPFERKLTRDEPFVTASGRNKILPAMLQSGTFRYYEQSEFQAVCLPYLNFDMAMYIFLPARNFGVEKFHRILNSAAWEKSLHGFDQVEGNLRLPRFKIDFAAALGPALVKLGMGRAFDRESADFGGIQSDPPAVWVGEILHRAVAELNEQGTEAAAATMAVTPMASLRPQLPQRRFKMIVDRPFLFVIRERRAGNILFIGSVADPG